MKLIPHRHDRGFAVWIVEGTDSTLQVLGAADRWSWRIYHDGRIRVGGARSKAWAIRNGTNALRGMMRSRREVARA